MRKHQRGLRNSGAAFGQGERNSNIIVCLLIFGWSDLGSWTALHEHRVTRRSLQMANLISSEASSR